jgi:hypothetical protein
MFNAKFINEVLKTYNSNEKNRELVRNTHKINDYDLNIIVGKRVVKFERETKFNETKFLKILYDSQNLAKAAREAKISYGIARKYVEINKINY